METTVDQVLVYRYHGIIKREATKGVIGFTVEAFENDEAVLIDKLAKLKDKMLVVAVDPAQVQ